MILIIAAYLLAIVSANLLAARYGPAASIPIAFVFIGFDLVARDKLHDAWGRHGRFGLAWRMLVLIAAGGAISYALNAGAGQIALASTVAFAAAAAIDAVVYQVLSRRDALVRSNGSNVPAAAVDSLLFPTIAFGGFLPWVVAGQFAAKVCGGLIWSLILYRRRSQ